MLVLAMLALLIHVLYVLDLTCKSITVVTSISIYQIIGTSDMLLVKCLSYRGL